MLPRHIEMASDVLFQELGGESILLNLHSERYFGLDEIGTRMWRLLTEQGTIEASLTQLREEYDIDEATLRRDLNQLVADLLKAGLIIDPDRR